MRLYSLLAFFLCAFVFNLLAQLPTQTFVVNKKNDSKETADIKQPRIYTFVEKMPWFNADETELLNFLRANLVYPQMERDNNIQGKVVVQFVVMADGTVAGVKAIKGVSPGLDKEAVRVVSLLSSFSPGMQMGQAVNTYYHIPIEFKLP